MLIILRSTIPDDRITVKSAVYLFVISINYGLCNTILVLIKKLLNYHRGAIGWVAGPMYKSRYRGSSVVERIPQEPGLLCFGGTAKISLVFYARHKSLPELSRGQENWICRMI